MVYVLEEFKHASLSPVIVGIGLGCMVRVIWSSAYTPAQTPIGVVTVSLRTIFPVSPALGV